MKQYLVKTNYAWQGELELPSFCILDEDELAKAKEVVSNFFERTDVKELVVDINEMQITFDYYKQVFGGYYFKATELRPEEVEIIKTHFSTDYGTCSLRDVLKGVDDALWYVQVEEEEIIDDTE